MKAWAHHPPTYLPEKLSWYRVGKLTVLDKGVVLKSPFAWSTKETKGRNSSSARDAAAWHSFLRVSCDTPLLPLEFFPRELEAGGKLGGFIYLFPPTHCAAFFIYDLITFSIRNFCDFKQRKNAIGFCMTHGSCEML